MKYKRRNDFYIITYDTYVSIKKLKDTEVLWLYWGLDWIRIRLKPRIWIRPKRPLLVEPESATLSDTAKNDSLNKSYPFSYREKFVKNIL